MLKKKLKAVFFLPLFVFCTSSTIADTRHGLAIYGAPALPQGFDSLPYVDSDAPKGGRITLGKRGRFDSLNPFITKGRAPWALRTHVFESLMARSWDEPFTVYGLLARSVDISDDRRSVLFTLDPAARFSDGSPVTPADVIFSMEILRDKGRPNFRSFYSRVTKAETVGEHGVRFDLAEAERELPLLLALMPVHSRADWEGRAFDETTLRPPLGSGPYRVRSHDPGERITFERHADYWGEDLPVNRGLNNFDEIVYRYFRDDNALWQAFRAGLVDLREESDTARWLDGYDFPAARQGEIERAEIPHGRATGMNGFVFNTRNPLFSDRRVRNALTHAFDFEWASAALNREADPRIESYYANSRLGFSGEASGRERTLLLPFADALPEGTLDAPPAWPVSSRDGRNRENLREAVRLLEDAGWRIADGILRDSNGTPFAFEILLASGDDEKVAAGFARALERLGIDVTLRLVDDAQYQARLTTYDFDMIVRRWWLSLSPGAEQAFYFGSEGVTKEGTRNYMGADNPAIDAMIALMLSTDDEDTYVAAVRALDRVLTTERYVIPLWSEPVDRVAWRKTLDRPTVTPLYGHRLETWWHVSE